jgi:hypothetical protein
MGEVREMQGGLVDITGQLFGTIRIVSQYRKRPLTWNVRCEKCGWNWPETHARIVNYGQSLPCSNSRCGQASVRADLLRDENALASIKESLAGQSQVFSNPLRRVTSERDGQNAAAAQTL